MDEQPITIVVSAEEHAMLLAALDKKVRDMERWFPENVARRAAYVKLRQEIADVQHVVTI